jgi:hypothetical protein
MITCCVRTTDDAEIFPPGIPVGGALRRSAHIVHGFAPEEAPCASDTVPRRNLQRCPKCWLDIGARGQSVAFSDKSVVEDARLIIGPSQAGAGPRQRACLGGRLTEVLGANTAHGTAYTAPRKLDTKTVIVRRGQMF